MGVTGLNGIEKLKNECHSSNPNEETMSRRKDVQICSHEPFFFFDTLKFISMSIECHCDI